MLFLLLSLLLLSFFLNRKIGSNRIKILPESVRQLNKPGISVRNIRGLKQGTLKIKRANTNDKGE